MLAATREVVFKLTMTSLSIMVAGDISSSIVQRIVTNVLRNEGEKCLISIVIFGYRLLMSAFCIPSCSSGATRSKYRLHGPLWAC
jgi:hypothetical protein